MLAERIGPVSSDWQSDYQCRLVRIERSIVKNRKSDGLPHFQSSESIFCSYKSKSSPPPALLLPALITYYPCSPHCDLLTQYDKLPSYNQLFQLEEYPRGYYDREVVQGENRLQFQSGRAFDR